MPLDQQQPEAAFAHFAAAASLTPDDLQYVLKHAAHALCPRPLAIAQLQHLHQRGLQNGASLDLLAQYLYQDNQLPAAKSAFAAALLRKPALRQQRMLDFAEAGAAPLNAGQVYLPRSSLRFESGAFADQAAFEVWLDELDLHVIDDFLPDFAAHRAAMLELPFHAQRYAGQNYPGIQTDGQTCPAIMAAIARVLGKTIKFASPDNGSCRLSFADSQARSDIHADNESGDSFALYAAVLYLNLPQQCRGGTSFWRHAGTGWSRRLDDATVRAQGYASFQQFQQRHLPHNVVSANGADNAASADNNQFNQLALRRSEWQTLLQLPMQANRLIIYRGDFFHAIGEVFGATPQDGRLAQLFFFETVDQANCS